MTRHRQFSLLLCLLAVCNGFSPQGIRHGDLNNININNRLFSTLDVLSSDQVTQLKYPLNTASTTNSTVVNGVAFKTGPLNLAVSKLANITLEQANTLVQWGAVWARMPALDEHELLSQYDNYNSNDNNDNDEDSFDNTITSSSRALYADLAPIKHSGQQDFRNADDNDEDDLDTFIDNLSQQRFRRILTATTIEAGTDLRIYTQPRRFQQAYNLFASQPQRLLYQDTTFIVVDKPPMLPSQPDASNYYECCPGSVQDVFGPFYDIDNNLIKHRPLLCHRVDACVGGCVVLSKNRNGQKVFSEFQQDRKIRKLYLAVTTNPVPLGQHVHWMWAPQSVRGNNGGPPCQLIAHQPPKSRRKARQYWQRCVLQVTACEGIKLQNDATKQYYQSTIRLVTGRKHQVRAQLASLNAPIIHDTLYTPMAGLTLESDEVELDVALSNCRVPTRPIGLQAHAILFGNNIKVKANPPWWQEEEVQSDDVYK